MVLYLDTSALVKLYVREEGREDVRHAVREAKAVAISKISYVEARSAFARREREGTFSKESHDREAERLRQDFEEKYLTRKPTSEVIVRAGELAREHALRAYDAVHLATALALRDEVEDIWEQEGRPGDEEDAPRVEFMTYDSSLTRAARREGLAHVPETASQNEEDEPG